MKSRIITQRERGDKLFGIAITLPAILILSFLYIFPVLYSFSLSFTNFNFFKLDELEFVGIKNYIESLISKDFINSLKVTATISFFSLIFEFLLGLLLAVMIYKISKGREFFKTFLLIPMMIAPVVVGLLFRFMLNNEFGILNEILTSTGLLKHSIGWLVSDGWAKASIIILDIWATTPLIFLILYAGLTTIPHDLYEAAMIDGASSWQSFLRITLPLIKRISLTAIFIRFMDVFRVFDSIYILTKGGPGRSTESLSMLIYRVNWINYDIGKASSMSFIMVIIMLIVAFLIGWLKGDHFSKQKIKA